VLNTQGGKAGEKPQGKNRWGNNAGERTAGEKGEINPHSGTRLL
jgi:hypothetical protein